MKYVAFFPSTDLSLFPSLGRKSSNDLCSLFLQHNLPLFAASHPSIEIHVSPRPHKHPVIRGHFMNGTQHSICVRNLTKENVLKKAEILRDMSGEKARKVKGGRAVASLNESTRGIWSPFHGAKAPSFQG